MDTGERLRDGRNGSDRIEGDTVGVTLGLSWTGTTPVEGLHYAIGISGYSYEFDADKARIAAVDFKETLITYKLALSYSF